MILPQLSAPLGLRQGQPRENATPPKPQQSVPLVAIKVMNLGDGYQPRYPNEPILQRRNDPGSTFMDGSFPALARY